LKANGSFLATIIACSLVILPTREQFAYATIRLATPIVSYSTGLDCTSSSCTGRPSHFFRREYTLLESTVVSDPFFDASTSPAALSPNPAWFRNRISLTSLIATSYDSYTKQRWPILGFSVFAPLASSCQHVPHCPFRRNFRPMMESLGLLHSAIDWNESQSPKNGIFFITLYPLGSINLDFLIRSHGPRLAHSLPINNILLAQSNFLEGPFGNPEMQPGMQPGPFDVPQMQPGMQPGPFDVPQVQPGMQPGPFGDPQMQPSMQPGPFGDPQMQPSMQPGLYGDPQMQPGMQPGPFGVPQMQPIIQPGTTGYPRNSTLRATNTARMRAEALNGGLATYRTAACMYQQSGGECLVGRTSEGFLFRFLGGKPGWQQLGKAPTLETEILIGLDGKTVIKVLYNGTPRGGSHMDLRPSLQQSPN
jgi:hypothetical protein